MACGNSVVPSTRMEAPLSKSPATMSGTLASRCMRFRNAASAYGSAFRTTRPFDQFTRIRPPTLSSRMSRTNLRYSRERELGDSPWKGMKTSCATSSRSVILLIQRRTVEEALGGAGGLAAAGRLRGGAAAAKASAAIRTATRRRGKGRTTASV